MLSELRRLLEKNDNLVETDLRGAANALLTQQFLYLDNDRQLPHYRIVTTHIDYYRDLFDALGWQLAIDHDFGYVGILPGDHETYLPLALEDTLILFIARLMFEEGVEAHQTQGGKVYVSPEDLLARYESLTHRERPKITEFRETLKLLQRHGMTIKDEDDPVTRLPSRLALLPALRQVAGDRIVERLEGYLRTTKHGNPETTDETGEPEDNGSHDEDTSQ